MCAMVVFYDEPGPWNKSSFKFRMCEARLRVEYMYILVCAVLTSLGGKRERGSDSESKEKCPDNNIEGHAAM